MNNMKNKFEIRKGQIDADVQSELDQIFKYFNEFKIDIDEVEDTYFIELQREDYCYCEDLSCGMRDLGVKEVNNTFCYNTLIGVCFSENWLPYINSLIINEKNTAIIHFDDHSDLMSPYIAKKNDSYFDMISGKVIDFNNSLDLLECTMSGAITIGSMLTAMIYSFNTKVDVFHIKRNSIDYCGNYKKTTFSDSFLGDSFQRLNIEISNEKGVSGDGMYIRCSKTKHIDSYLNAEKTYILHIDMDYFNNRFNGSNDWKQEWDSDNLSISGQKELFSDISDFIIRNKLQKKIKKIFIGLSPSFYPAEFWKMGLLSLVDELCQTGIDLFDVREKIKAGVLFDEKRI